MMGLIYFVGGTIFGLAIAFMIWAVWLLKEDDKYIKDVYSDGDDEE